MNRLRGISPVALVLLALVLTVGAVVAGYSRFAHAQQGVKDLSDGFSGALTYNSGAGKAVIVTATTISSSGPPVINPGSGAPGYSVPNARIHLKNLTVLASAATILTVYEHPTSGSDILICTVPVGTQTQPYSVKKGDNEVLGVNGYLTGVGSSIKILSTASVTVSGSTTYSLE